MSASASVNSSGRSASCAAWHCITTRTFLGAVFIAVPLVSGRVDLAVAQYLPRGRHQEGDRHLKFHEDRDNLVFVVEDDSQDHPDHVDGHRNVFLAASPYARQVRANGCYVGHTRND